MFAACLLESAACLPHIGYMPNYTKQRKAKTPPHVSLRALRRASGLTLEQVAEAVAEVLGEDTTVNRGTISAIESGLRGASVQMLAALEVAYGLEAGDITTTYEPRARAEAVPA